MTSGNEPRPPNLNVPLQLDAKLKANLIWETDEDILPKGRDRGHIRAAKEAAAQLTQKLSERIAQEKPETQQQAPAGYPSLAPHQLLGLPFKSPLLESERLTALLAWQRAARLEAHWESSYHHSLGSRRLAAERRQALEKEERAVRAQRALLNDPDSTTGTASSREQEMVRSTEDSQRSKAALQKSEQARLPERRQEARTQFAHLAASQVNTLAALQENQALRHELKREILRPALDILTRSPNAATLPVCGPSNGECMPASLPPLGRTRGSQRELRAIAAQKTPVNAAPNPALLATYILSAKNPQGMPQIAYLPEVQRKQALLIGVNQYQDQDIPALESTHRDVKAMAATLSERLGYAADIVLDGKRSDIVNAILELAQQVTPADSVMVYFAGHGFLDEDTGKGYWVPADGRADTPEKWISNDDIARLLALIPAKQIILISDSCYSGSLTREYKVEQGSRDDLKKAILDKRTVTVMSSGGEEPVSDEGKDGFSIFAWSMRQALQKVDRFSPGGSLFTEIKNGVIESYPQTPQYGASVSAGHQTGGDYYFEKRVYR